jgi:hypothetical protein
MAVFPVATWAAHLRAIARPVVDAGPDPEPTALARIVAAVVRRHPAPPPAPLAPHATPAERLWHARLDADVDVETIVRMDGAGPLIDRSAVVTVEVWTDAELAALHALWCLAASHDHPEWRERVNAARDWHMEHTQPDNATNRPWALHVFRLADTPESVHYAETLLHNCMAMTGTPDPLSALILLDAADALASA